MTKSNAAKRGAWLLALALVLRCGSAAASPPHVIKRIDASTAGTLGAMLGEVGNLFYFEANGFIHRSDGTAGGTFALAKAGPPALPRRSATIGSLFFTPSAEGLIRTDGTLPGTIVLHKDFDSRRGLVRFGEHVYFTTHAPYVALLWKTDGSPEGTSLVRIFANGGGPIEHLSATSDHIYVSTRDGTLEGLFAWDGTPNPPTLVSAAPGYRGGGVPIGERYFFPTFASFDSWDLWVTDGTVAGTVLLRRFPGQPTGMTALGDRLFFFAYSEGRDMEPWISDGTAPGTRWISEPARTEGDGYLHTEAFVIGTEAYYRDTLGSLWRSNGTAAGTYVVRRFPAIFEVAASKTRLVLRVWADAASSLWLSDGTAAGTNLVVPSSYTLRSTPLADLAGRVFFPLFTAEYGEELWYTDGTPSGTGLLVDLDRSTRGGNYFTTNVANATRSYFVDPTTGLWSTDGTEAGTNRVIRNGVQPPLALGATITVMNEVPYYCSSAGLWRIAEGDEGSGPVSSPGLACRWTVASGGSIFASLVSQQTGKPSLWRGDGQYASLVLLREFLLGEEPLFPTPFDPGILFGLVTPQGRDLWISDGSVSGTKRLKAMATGAYTGVTSNFLRIGPDSFFIASTPGSRIWRTDGTEAGTREALVNGPVPASLLGQIEGTLFFLEGGSGVRIWKTNFSAAGTQLVHENPNSLGFSSAMGVGRVFFGFEVGDVGMWSTDGTEPGTRRLTNRAPTGLTAVAGGVAWSDSSGLWFSDTKEGDPRNLGPVGFGFRGVARLGGMLIFSSSDAFNGAQPWRADIHPQPGSLYTLEPCRLLDTRNLAEAPGLVEGVRREVQITGMCGIPDDASAVVLNVTATRSTGAGHFELIPASRATSGSRCTAFGAGQTRASAYILGLDPLSRGRGTLQLWASGRADAIVDVSGYFR